MSKGNSGLFKKTKGDNASSNHIDFYVGANGKVLEGKYKRWIGVNRRNRLLKKAKNPKLRNAISQLYRQKSFIGDGGTASALKFEFSTGLGLSRKGKVHIEKAINTIKFLDRQILSNKTLSKSDRKLANMLKKKLILALGGKKHGK